MASERLGSLLTKATDTGKRCVVDADEHSRDRLVCLCTLLFVIDCKGRHIGCCLVGIRLLYDDSSILRFWEEDPSCNAEHNLRGDCWLDLRGLN